jgi:hypothetical protein
MDFDNYISYDQQANVFLQKLPKIQQDCLNKTMLQLVLYMSDNVHSGEILNASKIAAKYVIDNNLFDKLKKRTYNEEYLYCDIIRYYSIIQSNK